MEAMGIDISRDGVTMVTCSAAGTRDTFSAHL